MIKVFLYILTFVIVLPGELVIWGRTLDARLAGSYLAKRLRLSWYFDLPRELFLFLGIVSVCGMVCGFRKMAEKSHAHDILVFGGFPLYLLSLFLYFRLPCSVAFGVPLILLASAAAWCACRPGDRPAFLLPDDKTLPASALHRAVAFFQLMPVLLAASLLFQEGYLMWMSFNWTPLFAFLPLAGLLLPKTWQLREYAASSVYALILCALIYLTGQFFAEGVLLTDFGNVTAYIFLELMAALMIRPLLPPVRNIALGLLVLGALGTGRIMPAVCSPWFVVLPMYVLYLLIDNRKAIRKKLFSRTHFRCPDVHLLSWEEYAAQAWGFGAMLAVYLAGPSFFFPILSGLGLMLLGGLIRSRLRNNTASEHLILKNFPFAVEIAFLILSVVICCRTREAAMVLLSAYAAGACLMQMIWSIGSLIGRYTQDRPFLLFFHILSYAGMCFLLVLLFFLRAPASVLLGCFCILSGIIRIGRCAYRKPGDELELTAGWIMAAIGQFVFVSPPEVLLPLPEWSSGCVAGAFVACAASYVYRIFDFSNRKRSLNYER